MPLTVTKLDAAHGQLNAAIRLWFEGGDPVAIHTLVSAAHEIIHALFRKKGLKGLLFDTPLVRRDARQSWSGIFKSPANFFKHAYNETADAVIEFDPALSQLMMHACCKALRNLGEPISAEEFALTYWAFFSNPSAFPGRAEFLKQPKVQVIEKLVAKGREVYFREFCAAFGRGDIVPGATEVGPGFST
jgi:hypothetical protein